MSVDIEVARAWDDEKLLDEYERLLGVQATLNGWLYRGVVGNEIIALDEIARSRHALSLSAWRNDGIVASSWTDLFYVVHEWRSPCRANVKPMPLPDRPRKMVTCLECITR